jgi:SHS2 domain-containing protein
VSPYREIEHTADWALHVWAPTREALFEEAARGMFALAGRAEQAVAGAAGRQVLDIALEASDYESLLVAWLQELLYHTEADGWAFADFQVEALAPQGLRARAHGSPGQRPEKVIKAVTYHNLEIRSTGEGFEATLVFDV